MTTLPKEPAERFAVLCVDDELEARNALVRDLRELCGDALIVEGCSSADEALELAGQWEQDKVRVALILADQVLPQSSGVDLLIEIHERPWFHATRKVLTTAQATMDDLTRALNRGALNANLGKPWSRESLADIVKLLLTEYLIDQAPEAISRFEHLTDVAQLSRAFAATEHKRRVADQHLKTVQRSFIGHQNVSDREIEDQMIGELDQSLDHPERKHLPAGTVLLTEGQPVDGIWILVSGQVSLYRESGPDRIVFHSQTVGPIIGLMALANRQDSSFTCRALTDIVVIDIGLADLQEALEQNPVLYAHFVTVLLRSLARRNRRSNEQQIQINELNRQLGRERDHLSETLSQLERAQTRLVQSEKMATLGQLAAGIAHELNNPIAAITRSTDFLLQDIETLTQAHSDGEALVGMIYSALDGKVLSTREQRQLRTELAKALADEPRARRLTSMGITSAEEAETLLNGVPAAEQAARIDTLERYYQLGHSLRNLRSCASRITGLVGSLHSYARPDKAFQTGVDLHKGIEETLLLFGSSLRDVNLTRQYGTIPTVVCRAGEIAQVWTNLVSNALQFMTEPAELNIETDQPDPDHVRVRVTDNGPGIPEENRPRIFDVNFTTRQGEADFGLGLGLPICRDIVQRHGGELSVESEPGRTCFTIILPVRQDREAEPDNQPNEA